MSISPLAYDIIRLQYFLTQICAHNVVK